MGLAGAVREAAAVAPAVAAAVAVNGGGGGGGEWPSAIAIDGSLGVTLALVALALECALFAAVIVQTASTEPGTHVPLSRSFTLLFGLTAATAGLTAVTTLFGSSSAIAHAAATAACACLAGATLGTLPAAAAVVFPGACRRCVGWRGGRRAVDVGGTPLPSHGRCVPHHVPLPPGL